MPWLQFWNSDIAIQHGDTVVVGEVQKREHKNKWAIEGFMRTSWGGVGRNSAFRGGIDQTTHVVEALTSMCHIACTAQESALQSRMADALSSNDMFGLVISRSHDASPALVRFGLLQGDVYTHARYFSKIQQRDQDDAQ